MANPRKASDARKAADTGGTLPTRDQIVEFVRNSPDRVGKREIARAFNVRGSDRIALKEMIADLKREGLLGSGKGGRGGGRLPEVTVVEVDAITFDGEMLARPVRWEQNAAPPRIVVLRDRRGDPDKGDRLLVRLSRAEDGTYEARIMRRIERSADQVLGIYEKRGRDGGGIAATDRRVKYDIVIPRGEDAGAEDGELVLAEILPGRPTGARRARVIERYGDGRSPRAVSLIAVHAHGIPVSFSAEALADAARAEPPADLSGRLDLRGTPLVTIDGADARDFDDAVWAAPDDDPRNEGGWKVVVAIADVAWYVRPGGALDRDAFDRGNSVYFPDRVVPMLPERLSNDLCSLRPDEDRACMAALMWIDAEGRLLRHRFERAMMRSAARLTYEQAQAAHDVADGDGAPGDVPDGVPDGVIEPLYGAWRALDAARRRRETLDIDLPERKIELDETGRVVRIAPVRRLDSHRLIEEFMICANVAAAETLEARGRPCMYRIHEPPDPKGLESLRQVLADLEVGLPKGQVLKPRQFNRVLEATRDTAHDRLVNELVLRAQSRAFYGPKNLGHFGLALERYAHFTSPIRRYSDLLVHRALIGDGPGGLPARAAAHFADWGEHISTTERRAMAAERDANDRYMAAFLADRVGADFAGAVAGVTRAGLFVALDDTGASGLLPISLLPDDYYVHDEARHALVGQDTGTTFRLGEAIEVRLREANPTTGGLIFELAAFPSPTTDGDTRRGPRRAAGKPPPKGGAKKGGAKKGVAKKTPGKAKGAQSAKSAPKRQVRKRSR